MGCRVKEYYRPSKEVCIKGLNISLGSSKLVIDVYECVYLPSDDTYLLIDAVLSDLRGSLSGVKALEIGSGSGLVSLVLAHYGAEVISIDISPHAVYNTLINSLMNRLNAIDVIQGHGTSMIRSSRLFDLIVFNPPYLPCEDSDDWLDISWCGGRGGVDVLCGVVEGLSKLLKCGGYLYVVLSSLGDVGRALNELHRVGFRCVLKSLKHIFFEDIAVYRCVNEC
ncbi:MAG: methyltransferase [Thermoprotei archaeon]|nr:MAG: methyltransferase [Thermoprotei archaeon]